jgi:hypothetical protein
MRRRERAGGSASESVQLVELGDVDEIAGPPGRQLHGTQISERADRRQAVLPEVDEDRVLSQLLVWRNGRHRVQDLHIAVARVELERDRARERRARERTVDGVLGTEMGERSGKPFEILEAGLRHDIQVGRRAHNAMRGDSMPPTIT